MPMMRLEVVVYGALALGSASGKPNAKPSQQTSQSGKAPVVSQHALLVELFTSEGCSSCPPADDLLRKIDGKHTRDGTQIVGVSEHVTYWDHGGWKDPFDSDAITDRQNQYSGKREVSSRQLGEPAAFDCLGAGARPRAGTGS